MLTNLRNEGTVDRIARVVLGVALLGYAAVAHSWFGLIGVVPLVTGLTGFCPLYRLVGRSSCHT